MRTAGVAPLTTPVVENNTCAPPGTFTKPPLFVLWPAYRHADWLGSKRLSTGTDSVCLAAETSAGRGVNTDVAYAPYGERYANSVGTVFNFTGMDNDTKPDLYDFPAREYHPTQGRWVSPDKAGLRAVNLGNPQTWNRYAYVGGNPLTDTDPTGEFDDAIGDGSTCFSISGCSGGRGYFQTQLDASNRNVDFSFSAWANWNDRHTFDSYYYDLPGHSNPIEQALGWYIAQATNAFDDYNKSQNKKKTNVISGNCVDPNPVTNDVPEVIGTYRNPSGNFTNLQTSMPPGGKCKEFGDRICYRVRGDTCKDTYCAARYVPLVPGRYPGVWVPKPHKPTLDIAAQECSRVNP